MDVQFKEIESLLMKNIEKLPHVRCSGFEIVKEDVKFQMKADSISYRLILFILPLFFGREKQFYPKIKEKKSDREG